jgi:hypothetical protein
VNSGELSSEKNVKQETSPIEENCFIYKKIKNWTAPFSLDLQ